MSAPGAGGVTGRRAVLYLAVAAIVAVAVYGALSKIAGFSEIGNTLERAAPAWLAVALVLTVGTFACYAFLFHRVAATSPAGEPSASRRESYEIAFAGLGAATLFSAGGAGGVALEAWALSRLGLARREVALRLTTFNVLLYAVYMAAVIVFGLWLWVGLPGGPSPWPMTLLPATLAVLVIALFLVPAAAPNRGRSFRQVVGAGTRRAIELVRQRRGMLALGAAVGYWATNVATLGACFAAYGEPVAFAILTQAFFVGMVANLVPLLPGGAGTVDAGLVGAFVALGEPASAAVVAVLSYRLIAYWLPTIPEFAAFLRLRRLLPRSDLP